MTCGSVIDHLADAFPARAGPLGLLSGDEFRPPVAGFDRELIVASGARIGLVLCADHRAAPKSARIATEHFTSLGAEVVAHDLIHDGGLTACDLVYIGGGSPLGLVQHLRDAPAWRAIVDGWSEGLGVAGSSAGAMALCEHCLLPQPGARVPTEWSHGVGPVSGVALAVHASSRPREWLHELARAAPCPLVALDDHTGLLLRAGDPPSVIGPGRVWVVERETA